MLSIEQDHKCNADVTVETEKSFPIQWVRADAFSIVPGRNRKKVMLGVCGYSHRICRVTTQPFDTIVFSDVTIRDGECEDATSCLARECPLNKTPESTIKKLIHHRPRQFVSLDVLTGPRHCEVFQNRSAQ
jgi:hypothetical protein